MADRKRKHIVAWQRIDVPGTEYAEIALAPLHLEGSVVLVEDERPALISYRIEVDAAGSTSRAVVRLKQAGRLGELVLVRSPAGSWRANGRPLPQIDGIEDLDLSVSPSTNTLAIRRLRLAVGARAEVTAAWVRFPALDVVPLRQSYRRTSPFGYAYEAPELDFRAKLTVDRLGIVETYGKLWRRVPTFPVRVGQSPDL